MVLFNYCCFCCNLHWKCQVIPLYTAINERFGFIDCSLISIQDSLSKSLKRYGWIANLKRWLPILTNRPAGLKRKSFAPLFIWNHSVTNLIKERPRTEMLTTWSRLSPLAWVRLRKQTVEHPFTGWVRRIFKWRHWTTLAPRWVCMCSLTTSSGWWKYWGSAHWCRPWTPDGLMALKSGSFKPQ